MLFSVVYCLLLLISTIYCIAKKKNPLICILFGFYTGSALFSIIGIVKGIYKGVNITFFPFILLFVAYLLFFYPFYTTLFPKSDQMQIEIKKAYYVFAIIYIVLSAIAIYAYIPSVRSLLQSGNWAINRRMLYSNQLEFPDSGRIQHFANLFVGYFGILALVLGFLMFRDSRTRKIGIVLLASYALKVACSAIYTSSRGTITELGMLFIALYLFFYKDMGKFTKRFIAVIIVAAIISIVPFIIDVTVDRFTTGESATNSVIRYLGIPPLAFNYGVFPIKKLMFGEYAFGQLFGHNSFNSYEIGGLWGSSFYTFVGWIYIDWGTIGVIVWGVVSLLFWNKYLRREVWRVSDLFLIISFYKMLLDGVFVIGRSQCYTIISTIIIYFLIRIFFEKYSYRIGQYALD